MADTVAEVSPGATLHNGRIAEPTRLNQCCAVSRANESILRSWTVKGVLQQYRHIPDALIPVSYDRLLAETGQVSPRWSSTGFVPIARRSRIFGLSKFNYFPARSRPKSCPEYTGVNDHAFSSAIGYQTVEMTHARSTFNDGVMLAYFHTSLATRMKFSPRMPRMSASPYPRSSRAWVRRGASSGGTYPEPLSGYWFSGQ